MKITISKIILPIAFFLLACLSGCCSMTKESLSVRAGENVTYQCENGDRITARYYSLSDNSLNFVKVILPDAKEQTLPQGLSASGARYTDDRELVWWIKGDTARLEVRGDEGNWQTRYNDCQAVSGKK